VQQYRKSPKKREGKGKKKEEYLGTCGEATNRGPPYNICSCFQKSPANQGLSFKTALQLQGPLSNKQVTYGA